MSKETDVLIYKHWIIRLANMVYDIRKSWTPNENLDQAIPYLDKALCYIKLELEKEEK